MKLFKGLTNVGVSVLIGAGCLMGVETDKSVKSEVKAEEKTPRGATGAANESKDNESKVGKEAAEVKKTFTEDQQANFLKTYGWVTFMQSGVKNLGLSAKEVEHVMSGVQMAARGEELPCALGEVMEDLQTFLQEKSAAYAKIHQVEIKAIAENNRKAGKTYMENLLKTKPAIKTTATGLAYEIIATGDEAQKPSEMDNVEIRYTGRLIDGKVFDESKDRTVTFPLNGVVPGIKEGVQLVGKGGKIVLYVPSELGYGEFDIPSIPAGSHLIFDIELVNILKNEAIKSVEKPESSKTN
ncbi:MAG: FKBP-type peptidyl-prolyl cis-trans isomerase [Puniceicoccales bacterium]|jgi:FKBP-type peptidyl-prolyl cis-trans isomerase|nr:FKBP-type peptidyl-prolyl cis-trans isomerase [Puniceicoccales bacterium]